MVKHQPALCKVPYQYRPLCYLLNHRNENISIYSFIQRCAYIFQSQEFPRPHSITNCDVSIRKRKHLIHRNRRKDRVRRVEMWVKCDLADVIPTHLLLTHHVSLNALQSSFEWTNTMHSIREGENRPFANGKNRSILDNRKKKTETHTL